MTHRAYFTDFEADFEADFAADFARKPDFTPRCLQTSPRCCRLRVAAALVTALAAALVAAATGAAMDALTALAAAYEDDAESDMEEFDGAAAKEPYECCCLFQFLNHCHRSKRQLSARMCRRT